MFTAELPSLNYRSMDNSLYPEHPRDCQSCTSGNMYMYVATYIVHVHRCYNTYMYIYMRLICALSHSYF